jgi:glycosyltransferase involved in cell wall biosynthesis
MFKHIIAFNNGIVTQDGMSGSDNRAVNWTRIWSEVCKVTLIIPVAGQKRYGNHKAKEIITTNHHFNSNSPIRLLVEYIFRTLKAINKTTGKIEDCSLIYSSSDLIPDAIPALILKYRNRNSPHVKLIMGCHLLAPHPFNGYTGKTRIPSLQNLYYYFSQTLILKFARRWADKILVSNTIDQKFLIERKFFASNQVLVTYGALDLEGMDSVNRDVKEFDAIFVGRAHPQKGVDDLILAWKEVNKVTPQAKLVIVGERNTFTAVQEKIKALGLDKDIIFAGFLSGPEKYNMIKKSKLLVFPSHYESFGMVALEALACGVPVVAYDLDIYKEIYADKLITVPKGDTAALAKAITTNLNRYQDTDFVDSLIEFSKKFDFRRTAQMVFDCE